MERRQIGTWGAERKAKGEGGWRVDVPVADGNWTTTLESQLELEKPLPFCPICQFPFFLLFYLFVYLHLLFFHLFFLLKY